MKIFAIRDVNDKEKKDLAYLLYYEISRQFYIEINDKADIWEVPFLLSSFVKKGEYTLDSYWSRIWVQQRIVPSDRQNIGRILLDNGLKTYDEYKLLTLASGRCEQDDYYLVSITENELPQNILRRFNRKIEEAVPLKDFSLLLFFRDGTVIKSNMKEYFQKDQRFRILLTHPEYFRSIKILPGGYGISWDESLTIPYSALYSMGKRIHLTLEDFHDFLSDEIINASEAAEILTCSRQYINELVKKEKLHPVKSFEKTTLFLKSEVHSLNW